MITRITSSEEEQRACELFAIAFEQPLDRTETLAPDERYTRWASFDDTGRMMSTLTALRLNMRFDGNLCTAAGIGGVATLPQDRRRGGIRACFSAMLPWLFEHGFEMSYLYPFSTAYYRQFGYESCVTMLGITMDMKQLRAFGTKGKLKLSEPCEPLAEEIRKIDGVMEKRYNMMVLHDEQDYDWVGKNDPAADQTFCYVYFRRDGSPASYTVFKKANESDGRNLVCSRFCFYDREGFEGLAELFFSLAADHNYLKFSVPNVPAISYLMPEWSLGAMSRRLEASGMVRVINARRVLEKACYIGSGSIRIRLCDRYIRQNSKCFQVDFSQQGTSVEEIEGEPDITLDISAFSALIAGVCDFKDALLYMDGIEVNAPDAPFASVFYAKPMMIADYF